MHVNIVSLLTYFTYYLHCSLNICASFVHTVRSTAVAQWLKVLGSNPGSSPTVIYMSHGGLASGRAAAAQVAPCSGKVPLQGMWTYIRPSLRGIASIIDVSK